MEMVKIATWSEILTTFDREHPSFLRRNPAIIAGLRRMFGGWR